jgi:transposase
VEDIGERVDRHTRSIVELVESWSLKPPVKALQALRGVNIITATVLAAELGDLTRFDTAPQLMGYLGLVPSEYSTGETRQQGRITRAGNSYARRILVEAAWAYRFRASKSAAIRARSRDVSEEVQRLAWRAQERLCARYRKLIARGKNKNRTVVAIARELAGFVWAIGRQPKLLAV